MNSQTDICDRIDTVLHDAWGVALANVTTGTSYKRFGCMDGLKKYGTAIFYFVFPVALLLVLVFVEVGCADHIFLSGKLHGTYVLQEASQIFLGDVHILQPCFNYEE
jgi:hypothetical protein